MAFFVPCHEQQITAEKTNRCPSWHTTLPCHEQQSTAEKTKKCPRLLMHSWCIPGALLVHSWCTSGALLVHSWCTPGALLVHSWFTPGALVVHSWCTPGALPVHFRCILVHSRCTPKVSRKGIVSLPKGSLDPPFRNVWIAFSLTYKPERELPRFRKEASILRTETSGSHSVKARANDPPHENRLDRPRNYHIHH